MDRFGPLMTRANIQLGDLPEEVELNGVLMYVGEFPHGAGRLLLHPSLGAYDSPRATAVIAHELSHPLLSVCGNHPPSVLPLLLDPTRRKLYRHYEAEVNCLAAHLLIPPDILAAFPSPRFPTAQSLAQALGVPAEVVRRAFWTRGYDARRVRNLLRKLTGRPDFIEPDEALAA